MHQSTDGSQLVARRLGGAGAILLAHFVAMVFVVLEFAWLAPAIQVLFEELDVELPKITQQVLVLSHLFCWYWYLILFATVVLDAGILVVLAVAAPRQRWPAAVYSHLFLLLTIVLLYWINLALCLPLIALAQSLAG